MLRVTSSQRVYLAAVAILALWVGFFCYFDPAQSDWGIPWLLPPLCATFLGSMYLSGAAGLTACILSRQWVEIRSFIPAIAIWTGGLTIVSLFYLSAFDFHKLQVQVWFGAYVAFPVIGMALLWKHREHANVHPQGEPRLPRWVRMYLSTQGIAMTGMSIALILGTPMMQTLWPWKTGLLMLQLYSQPFLAYGVCSLILARQQTWSEIRTGFVGMAVFTGAEVIAVLRFASLFDGIPLSVALWLAAFSGATAIQLIIFMHAVRAARSSQVVGARQQMQVVRL